MLPALAGTTSVDSIVDEVCRQYGVTRSEFLSPYRAQRTSRARQDAAYRLRTQLALNPRQIGVALRRSRGAAINLLAKFEARLLAEATV